MPYSEAEIQKISNRILDNIVDSCTKVFTDYLDMEFEKYDNDLQLTQRVCNVLPLAITRLIVISVATANRLRPLAIPLTSNEGGELYDRISHVVAEYLGFGRENPFND